MPLPIDNVPDATPVSYGGPGAGVILGGTFTYNGAQWQKTDLQDGGGQILAVCWSTGQTAFLAPTTQVVEIALEFSEA